LEKWIKEIKEYEPNDYIFKLIDIDDEIILESYISFQKYINSADDDFDNLAILRDAQYM
jgi:disulfide oxidoreductase YuzD